MSRERHPSITAFFAAMSGKFSFSFDSPKFTQITESHYSYKEGSHEYDLKHIGSIVILSIYTPGMGDLHYMYNVTSGILTQTYTDGPLTKVSILD